MNSNFSSTGNRWHDQKVDDAKIESVGVGRENRIPERVVINIKSIFHVRISKETLWC
jgi:hypothetical protein